jgi:regulatory protein
MESQVKQMLMKLQQICSKQEKCPADIYEYLDRKGIPRENHQEVVDCLVADRFVDEDRYARAAVQDKIRLNHWGRIKVRHFLESRQISEAIIEEAMKTIDQDEYIKMVSHELRKRKDIMTEKDRERKRAMMIKYGMSKGYEEEIVENLLD